MRQIPDAKPLFTADCDSVGSDSCRRGPWPVGRRASLGTPFGSRSRRSPSAAAKGDLLSRRTMPFRFGSRGRGRGFLPYDLHLWRQSGLRAAAPLSARRARSAHLLRSLRSPSERFAIPSSVSRHRMRPTPPRARSPRACAGRVPASGGTSSSCGRDATWRPHAIRHSPMPPHVRIDRARRQRRRRPSGDPNPVRRGNGSARPRPARLGRRCCREARGCACLQI